MSGKEAGRQVVVEWGGGDDSLATHPLLFLNPRPLSPSSFVYTADCTVPAALWLWKPLSNGDTAVLMMNNDVVPNSLTVDFSQVPGLAGGGGSTSYSLRDIGNHADLGQFTGSYTAANLPAQGSAFLRISKA